MHVISRERRREAFRSSKLLGTAYTAYVGRYDGESGINSSRDYLIYLFSCYLVMDVRCVGPSNVVCVPHNFFFMKSKT